MTVIAPSLVSAALPCIFPRHIETKLRGLAPPAQSCDPRAHRPSPPVPGAVHAPADRKCLFKTAQTSVCKKLLTMHGVRCGAKADSEVGLALRNHLLSTFFSRVPRSIADYQKTIRFEASESFTRRH